MSGTVRGVVADALAGAEGFHKGGALVDSGLSFDAINLSNWSIGTATTVYVKNQIRIDTR